MKIEMFVPEELLGPEPKMRFFRDQKAEFDQLQELLHQEIIKNPGIVGAVRDRRNYLRRSSFYWAYVEKLESISSTEFRRWIRYLPDNTPELPEELAAIQPLLVDRFGPLFTVRNKKTSEGALFGPTPDGRHILLARWAPEDRRLPSFREISTIIDVRNRQMLSPEIVNLFAVTTGIVCFLLFRVSDPHNHIVATILWALGSTMPILFVAFCGPKIWKMYLARKFKKSSPDLYWAL